MTNDENANVKGAYQLHIRHFINPVLITCPKCGQCAQSQALGTGKPARLSCLSCGYLAEKPLNRALTQRGQVHRLSPYGVIIGQPVDPYFHERLWLKTVVKGHVFWAYNFDHLDLLEQHITSKIRISKPRSDPSGYINKSIGSRLPRWMTAAKNREDILKAIAKLKKKQTNP